MMNWPVLMDPKLQNPQDNIIMDPGGQSQPTILRNLDVSLHGSNITEEYQINLSQDSNSTYTSLIQQMDILGSQNAEDLKAPQGSFTYLLTAPYAFENHLYMTTNMIDENGQIMAEHLQNRCIDHNQHKESWLIHGENADNAENESYDVETHMNDIPDQVNAEHVEVEENQAIAEDEHVQASIDGEINSENNANEIQTTKIFENITEEDIEIFLENESIKAAQKGDMQIETHHVPHLDMTFQTEDEAQKFYNSYAFIAGFSVLKAGTYLSRKKEANNAVTRVTFRCNKSGKPKEGGQLAKRKEDKPAKPSKKRKRKSKEGTSTEPAIGKRKSNTVILTGCPAAMVIKLKDTTWHVIRLNLEHNHELSPPGESRFLRSHKNMSDAEKKLIRTLNSVQIPNRKIMAILSFLRGGLSAVPFTKKHVSNLRTSMRKELNQNDMMQVLAFFSQKQSEDPRFFYTFQADENNTVKSIFWSDANCRSCYYQYGDCVSFDTTYRTNKYNLPFAPFVGISGHGDNCLFGCAFLKDETIETFTWLFRTFLTCMGGKAPITVITDQDIAMRTAIGKVFPETNHRNCLFHIQKKAQEKASMCFRRIPGLHDEFMDVLNNSLTEKEFENLWVEMITKYQIQNIKYFQDMWNTRKRFVPVYFKQQFYPFIQTTARSEGTNSVFKDNVASTYSIISFLGEYQRIVDTIEEKQKQQDSVTRGTKPSYWPEYYFERQAARLYNRAIFYRFQQELKGTTKLNIEERELNRTYEVFKSETHAMREFRPRRFIVKIDKQNEQYSCICAKFQKDGILCMHVLKVLIQMNITELPERYFLDRWRPKEKKNIRAHDHNIPKDLGGENSQLRFNILSRKMVDLASQGSKTAEKYAYILKEMDRIEQELESIPSTGATTTDKPNMYHQISSTDLADGSTTIELNDPLNSNPKGRPQKQKGRLKPLAEQLKHIITCSHCGSHDHNVQTCPKMHEDMSSTRKKKNSTRKVTGQTGGVPNKKHKNKGATTENNLPTEG